MENSEDFNWAEYLTDFPQYSAQCDKWNDFECCPEGTVETKNTGFGNKYICCPEGNKALDGECLEVN